MGEYKKVETSPEVWDAIRAKHRDRLTVFSSFSDPSGTFCGGSGMRGRMETTYGFPDADWPLIEAKTTWTIDQAKPYERVNEQHQYWLCLPQRDEDD